MILLFLDYHKNHEIYSEEDITNVIIHTMPLSIGVVTDISPDVKLVLYNSGHILGSTSIHLHIGNGNHNLVYTGIFLELKHLLLKVLLEVKIYHINVKRQIQYW